MVQLYTSTCEIPTLLYTWSLKKVHLWGEASLYRDYSQGNTWLGGPLVAEQFLKTPANSESRGFVTVLMPYWIKKPWSFCCHDHTHVCNGWITVSYPGNNFLKDLYCMATTVAVVLLCPTIGLWTIMTRNVCILSEAFPHRLSFSTHLDATWRKFVDMYFVFL